MRQGFRVTLDSVVQVVLDKGKSEADAILAEAQAERQRMLSEVRSEAEKALEETEARARQIAARKRVQELARAELEARKTALAAQKEVLDDVYARTLVRLGSLKENTALLQGLLRANQGEWKSGGKVYSNAKDEPTVRAVVGPAYAGRIECTGGVVIESADSTRRTDLRYESMLRDVWNDSVREVAQVLWPSRASHV